MRSRASFATNFAAYSAEVALATKAGKATKVTESFG